MQRIFVSLAALLMLAGIAYAAEYVQIKGSDGTTDLNVKVDANGNLITVGAAADDAAATGAPVLMGCKYLSTPNTVEDGDASFVSCDARTNQTVALRSNAADNLFTSTPVDDVTNAYSAYVFNTRNFNFDGTTWDREFSCGSSAVITVAAAATTEIVALSASTVVRVCSFLVTGDTAATVAQFVDGTGSNCATSPSNMTGAMRMVDEGNLALSAANGSIFRGRAGRAICLTATTGAVTGVLSYAQF